MRLSQPTRIHGARTQKTINQISTVYSNVPDFTTSWPQSISLLWQPPIRQYSHQNTFQTFVFGNQLLNYKIWPRRRHVKSSPNHPSNYTMSHHRSHCRMQRPRRRHSYVIQVTPMTQQHYMEPDNPRHSESSEHELHCVTTQKTTA